LSKSTKVAIIVVIVLILDQALKIWVKTNMEMGDDIKMLGLNWARLHFVENPGMAFGWEIAGDNGKLILSLFRIAAVGGLIYLIRTFIKAGAPFGLMVSFSLVLAGAIGNIIDSAFYGMIFSASKTHGGLAMMFPPEGGYASFLHGKVVDMFYFPMFHGNFPEWFPFWGGERFTFFRPVFNIADSAITIGVLSLIFFHRNFFNGTALEEKKKMDEAETAENVESVSENETTVDSKPVETSPEVEEKLNQEEPPAAEA